MWTWKTYITSLIDNFLILEVKIFSLHISSVVLGSNNVTHIENLKNENLKWLTISPVSLLSLLLLSHFISIT